VSRDQASGSVRHVIVRERLRGQRLRYLPRGSVNPLFDELTCEAHVWILGLCPNDPRALGGLDDALDAIGRRVTVL